MDKKLISIFIVALVVVGAGSFFGGMKYTESKTSSLAGFGNLTEEQRSQMVANGGPGTRGSNTGTSFINGEIISKDDTSITVKLNNGGSKIVFYSDSTQITKSASGTASDLEAGTTVTINGKTNDDGSVTAQTIQTRPEKQGMSEGQEAPETQ